MKKVSTVILAAGEGKRMNSALPKVLHRFCGRSLLGHVVAAASQVSSDLIVVVGHGADSVQAQLGDSVRYAHQKQQKGTGHAVMQAAELLPREGTVLILCGDTPLLSAEILFALLTEHNNKNTAVTVLTAVVPNPAGYGRIVRTAAGAVQKIVEEKDASLKEKEITEINTGTYVFAAAPLHAALKLISNNNAQGEYYLTDCLEILLKQGFALSSHCLDDYRLALGVNDRAQLAEAGSLMRERINTQLMAAGVTIVDAAATYIDAGVEIGRDTIIYPGAILAGATTIGEECAIGPFCEISHSQIGSRVTISHSVATESVMDDDVSVGPFAHLRPGTRLRKGVKVGDFVEIKKSDIGEQSKIPHLSYVGDAQIGSEVNLGAGTIVVNYDGREKHVTNIEDGAFIGCNSNLVAPLSIGKGAFVAAGSTITKDVPAGALSLARPKQVNKENMGKRFLKKQ
ncbi:MAG: bifunctional UDP-N-acetylglucosamine diphosphorylase/glucosamine-1-phosphate N-acetyltransferase GlmU [Dethiobacter sp.]|jgi:bifunctional UDP-N-acetylglucosamine pyrophosphorylase/glucosamine-1-phosphate N-acetyltransferase|nr:bifunctional UDP-N-acetylglucosamine diphosphorylase/glucosamine-1-phosphate N-acetyltransferase GlmU [Dethiobacter sp.]